MLRRLPPGSIVRVEDYNELVDAINAIYEAFASAPGVEVWRMPGRIMLGPGREYSRRPGWSGQPGQPQFFAEIVGRQSIGANRWRYLFREVALNASNAWIPVEGGRSGYAHNLIEYINDGQDIEGDGVDHSRLEQETPDFEMQPCPVGNIVVMYVHQPPDATEPYYWFAYENSSDGPCPRQWG